jgi:hypothetical protein
MMQLEGSCHCGAVHFSLLSTTPVPYQRCYCSICRKTQGGGGYAINVYHAVMREEGQRTRASGAERHFCRRCGSALWLYDPEWPDLVHPFASAIDTPLPAPPETTHLMLDFKAPWVTIAEGSKDKKFGVYPKESLADWHERLGLTSPD